MQTNAGTRAVVACTAAVALTLGCGSRTGLDLWLDAGDTDPALDARTEAAIDAGMDGPTMCVAAPAPRVFLSLDSPLPTGTGGGNAYALVGDATRLYTTAFAHDDAAEYVVLSIDPCTGAYTSFGSTTGRTPLTATSSGPFYQSPVRPSGQTVTIDQAGPLGQSPHVVAPLGMDTLAILTIAAGRGYAIDESLSSVVTLALDGTAPTTLVPGGAWGDGLAVDDVYAYFYSANGVARVPVTGGPMTKLFDAGGGTICGSGEPPDGANSLLLIDDQNIYLAVHSGLLRVAKDGSSSSTYDVAGMVPCSPIAQDDTFLYFWAESGLSRVAKQGGSPETLAAENDSPGGIVVTPTSIYWMLFTHSIMKLDKP